MFSSFWGAQQTALGVVSGVLQWAAATGGASHPYDESDPPIGRNAPTAEEDISPSGMPRALASIAPETLGTWGAALESAAECSINGGQTGRSRLPVDAELNSKIVIFEGDICCMGVDAVVNFTNECYDSKDSPTACLISKGGAAYRRTLQEMEACRCGEGRISAAFVGAPCGHIIHTVGPRYTGKYHTAAENTLHSCYKESIQLLHENKLSTIAFPCYFSRRSRFPRELVVHVALRTIRRWMNLLKDHIDLVVLCSSCPDDTLIYNSVMPLYFPRSQEEEELSIKLLPTDIGNEYGEKVIEERQIPRALLSGATRRRKKPRDTSAGTAAASTADDSDGHTSGTTQSSAAEDDSSSTSSTSSISDDILAGIDLSFSEARREETESQRRSCSDDKSAGGEGERQGEELYSTYYRASRQMAQSGVFRVIASQHPFLYMGGHDHGGRKVIVFVAAAFPAQLDWHQLLLYMVWTLDAHTQDKFTLLYLSTGASSANKPALQFLREMHTVISSKYHQTLDQFLVLHASVPFRLLFSCYWAFMPPRLWQSAVYLDSLEDLLKYADPTKLRLPKFVEEADAARGSAVSVQPSQNPQRVVDYGEGEFDALGEEPSDNEKSPR